MVHSEEEHTMKLGLRIWTLIIALIFALLIIFPLGSLFEKGVLVKSVDRNSSAFEAGLASGMIIKTLNGEKINNVADYQNTTSKLFEGGSNTTKKIVFGTNKGEVIIFTDQFPTVIVGDLEKTRIKTGLDLSGGVRAVLKPVNSTLTAQNLSDLISAMEERLNVYGLKDISIRPHKDYLSGDNSIIVEMADAAPKDLEDLLSKQGKFQAKIGNVTVFTSDNNDILRVHKESSVIRGCYSDNAGGSYCRFEFALTISQEAAKRHAEITKNLPVDDTGRYLVDKLNLLIDGNEVSSLSIGVDLKGLETSQIQIQGSGSGRDSQTAFSEANKEMRQLQTILQTGSLPYKLQIEKLDTISPKLGHEFTQSLLLLGVMVFLIVSLAVFIKYRKINVTFAVILTIASEAVLTLAVASFLKWNLDAPSIAGIIAGIGTGINDQIIILDEALSGKGESSSTMRERVKRALFVIVGAFFTIVVAMLPLFWAGAGLLKGFALTTIIGVTMGILITRPAFAEIIRRIGER